MSNACAISVLFVQCTVQGEEGVILLFHYEIYANFLGKSCLLSLRVFANWNEKHTNNSSSSKV